MVGTLQYFMLPYIEQDAVYKQMAINHNDSWWCGYHVKTYWSPADPSSPPEGLSDSSSRVTATVTPPTKRCSGRRQGS